MIIIDDVIDKELQDEIERSIFGKETKWTFSRSVFYDKHPEVTEIQKKSLMSFTKQLIDPNGLKEPDYNLYANILSGIESKTNRSEEHRLNSSHIPLSRMPSSA